MADKNNLQKAVADIKPFDPTKKKKKKKTVVIDPADDSAQTALNVGREPENLREEDKGGVISKPSCPEPDYTYVELLGRVFRTQSRDYGRQA